MYQQYKHQWLGGEPKAESQLANTANTSYIVHPHFYDSILQGKTQDMRNNKVWKEIA